MSNPYRPDLDRDEARRQLTRDLESRLRFRLTCGDIAFGLFLIVVLAVCVLIENL